MFLFVGVVYLFEVCIKCFVIILCLLVSVVMVCIFEQVLMCSCILKLSGISVLLKVNLVVIGVGLLFMISDSVVILGVFGGWVMWIGISVGLLVCLGVLSKRIVGLIGGFWLVLMMFFCMLFYNLDGCSGFFMFCVKVGVVSNVNMKVSFIFVFFLLCVDRLVWCCCWWYLFWFWCVVGC